jgi:hypothetical protein
MEVRCTNRSFLNPKSRVRDSEEIRVDVNVNVFLNIANCDYLVMALVYYHVLE